MKNKLRMKFMKGVALGCAAAVAMPALFTSAAVNDKLTDRVTHTDLNFEDLTYEIMKEEDFDAIVEGLEDLTADEDNADEVLAVIIGMEDYINQLTGYYSLCSVYDSLHVDDSSYDDDIKTLDELYTNVIDKVWINYRIIAESPCSDVLKNRIDDDDEWQDILDYEAMTQTQKDLNAQETDLVLQFDELYNADYTANIDGVDYTADELDEAYSNGTITFNQYLQGVADTLTARNEALGNLYIELVLVRNQIAAEEGYDNYAEYRYAEAYDRDYTPDEIEDYRTNVKDYMVPLQSELYDLLYDGDEDYISMLNAAMTEEECLTNLETYLPEISEDLLVSYQYMIDHNMYDISVDDNKEPGAYTTSFQYYNAPFLFNCADGTISDMQTLIHEFGHYNEFYYASEDEWYYGSTNLDLAEIHSQGMELLFTEYAEDIYGDNAAAMEIYNLFSSTYSMVQGCKEDEFQQKVYALDDDEVTLDKLNELYYEVCDAYGDLDWHNSYYLGIYGLLAEDQATEWVEIPHTFKSPLYYISYSTSQAAVEELREAVMEDREEGITTYLDLVNLGFEGDFRETLVDAGLNDPIENPNCEAYAENIRVLVGLSDAVEDEVDPVIEEDNKKKDKDKKDKDKDKKKKDKEDKEAKEEPAPQTFLEKLKAIVTDPSNPILYAIAGGLALIIAAIVVVVVVVTKKSKKKKALQGEMASENVPAFDPKASGFTPVQGINLANQPTYSGGAPAVPAAPKAEESKFAPKASENVAAPVVEENQFAPKEPSVEESKFAPKPEENTAKAENEAPVELNENAENTEKQDNE